MNAHPVTTSVQDLVEALRDTHGVQAEADADADAGRVTVALAGASLSLFVVRGWWCRERDVNGYRVPAGMHPVGMEWITARAVVAELSLLAGARPWRSRRRLRRVPPAGRRRTPDTWRTRTAPRATAKTGPTTSRPRPRPATRATFPRVPLPRRSCRVQRWPLPIAAERTS